MTSHECAPDGADTDEGSDLFAGLTESATIVVAKAGESDAGESDMLLLSMRVSDLVAEYVDLRSDHGDRRLAGSALQGAKNVRDDIVTALKTLNAAILAAELAAMTKPKAL